MSARKEGKRKGEIREEKGEKWYIDRDSEREREREEERGREKKRT